MFTYNKQKMADENHSDFSEPNDLEFFSDDDLNDSIDQLVEPEKSAEMNWKDKLVCFRGFKITTFINKNGEEKKKLNLPAWKEITKPQTYKEGTAQAIRTGKWSGISVIDFDDSEGEASLFNGIISKPFNLTALQERIETLLESSNVGV